jgi:hypothetical protein
MQKSPRLRTATKITPPYYLNNFPKDFGLKIGKQIIYHLATKSPPSLEGPEWEKMFAKAIGAQWKPSNVGLDDIVLKNCAWGAKTVKQKDPWSTTRVRLISGRNSPVYSYGSTIDTSVPPDDLGKEILGIWNARVDSIRSKYAHARTVVLIKSDDLLKLTIFEAELLRYDPSLYKWTWNKRGNLEGWRGNNHCFTWQPHGSQFTIVEDVPEKRLHLKLRKPQLLETEKILDSLGFDKTWVEVIKPDN